jgi:hypothetical protein
MQHLEIRTLIAVFATALVFGCAPADLGNVPEGAEAVEDDDDDDAADDDDATDPVETDDDDAAGDDDDAADPVETDDDDAAGDDDDSWPDLPDDDDDDDPVETDDDDDVVPEGSGLCAPVATLSCGMQIAADTNDAVATSEISGFSCSSWDATGPELSYSLVAEQTGPITATLVEIETGQDLDLYVLDGAAGCAADQCIAYGNAEATFDAVAGETYHLVVDGYYGAAGGFVLDVACGEELPAGDDDDDDDDDDGPVDPIDPDPQPDPEPEEDGFCVPSFELADGDLTVAANNAVGSTSAIDQYGCVDWDESGPEVAYAFTAQTSGQATVHVEALADELIELVFGSQDDLDLFVLSGTGCDSDSCAAFGDDTVSWYVTAGSTWVIVVDGAGGDSSPFELSLDVVASAPTEELECGDGLDDDADGLVDCDDPDCSTEALCLEETCVPSRIIGCGETDSWNNSAFGSWNLVDGYACNAWDESGPEVTYLFQAASDVTVTASLAGMDADLDLFVVGQEDGYCDADTCIAHGNAEASFSVSAGETVYVVVDGYAGAVSDYDLSLSCE